MNFEFCSEHHILPGEDVLLSCPVIEGETITSVTWYITRPNQARVQLDLTGTVSQGERFVDLDINNISSQLEGYYSCGRTFEGRESDSSPVDVACVFVIGELNICTFCVELTQS